MHHHHGLLCQVGWQHRQPQLLDGERQRPRVMQLRLSLQRLCEAQLLTQVLGEVPRVLLVGRRPVDELQSVCVVRSPLRTNARELQVSVSSQGAPPHCQLLHDQAPLPLHRQVERREDDLSEALLKSHRGARVPEAEREELNQQLDSQVGAIKVTDDVRQHVGRRELDDHRQRIDERRRPLGGRRGPKERNPEQHRVEADRGSSVALLRRGCDLVELHTALDLLARASDHHANLDGRTSRLPEPLGPPRARRGIQLLPLAHRLKLF